MEILKQGNLDRIRANSMKKFECGRCGCVFMAASDEYKLPDFIAAMHDGIEASCECPCCGCMAPLYR